MRTSVCRGGFALILAVVALLSWQSGTAQAHPQFIGKWTAVDPKGAIIEYDFAPAEYITDNVWRGTFTLYIAHFRISCGNYELRIESGLEGTVGLRDGVGITTSVANVDLGTRQMLYKHITFTQAPPRP